MLVDRLETRRTVEFAPARTPAPASRRTVTYAAAAILGFAAYAAMTGYILATNTARVYGFPVSRDLRSMIEIAFEICPMMAAFILVLLLPAKERLIDALTGRMHRTAAMLAASAIASVITVLATGAAIAYVDGLASASVAPRTLLWVAVEFGVDLTMIGCSPACSTRSNAGSGSRFCCSSPTSWRS
jgi:hypothetical protein